MQRENLFFMKFTSCKLLEPGGAYFKSTAICLPCSYALLWHHLLFPTLKRILGWVVVELITSSYHTRIVLSSLAHMQISSVTTGLFLAAKME